MQARPPLTRRFGWRTAAALVVGALLVGVLAIVVEPALLLPLIQHVVHSRSGRAIEFSALRIGLDERFDPRLEFDDLMIENATWAVAREPLVRARRVGLDLTWGGLWSGLWVIKRLVLEDARIDLERDGDGRRNSRLSSSDGRGPTRARVLSVDGRASRLQILDRMTGLELRVRSTPLAAPRVVAGLAALPLTRALAFEGVQRGTAFSGHADVSDLLTLQQSGERFALQGEIRTEAARMTVAGSAADLLGGLRVDADLHLEADPLSGLDPGLLPRLPPLRDVVADAHLVRDAERFRVTRLRATSGAGEIEGSFDVAVKPGERTRLDARLHAARFDLDAWVAAHGAGAARVVAGKAAGPASARKPDPASGAPVAAFDWRGLARIDAAIDLGIAEVVAAKTVVARDASLKATLEQARLRIALADARLAGGHGSGEFRLDAAATPASASVDARLAGVQLRDLPPTWRVPHEQLRGGHVSATLSLGVRGVSPAEWVGSASGSLRASLEGASVSDRLEAKLGLDGLGFLRSLLSGADAVPVRCAEVALDLQGGRGVIRRLMFYTARTAVVGSGSIDFVSRTLDVVLAPSSHVDKILALDRDIRLHGPLAKPRASLQAAGARAAPPACASG